MGTSRWVACIAVTLVLTACTSGAPQPPTAPPHGASVSSSTTTPDSTPPPAPASPSPSTVQADPDRVRTATVRRAVRHLAGAIGPRPATTSAYRRAARWVSSELGRHGWEATQQGFAVPGGRSVAGPTQGMAVDAGRSVNVIGTRGDISPGEPWLLVGAHLDTVPTSPGAEDNASGVAALLAVAEAVEDRGTRLPVVLVAFGAEEPRGPSDEDHHYGSRAFVASLTGIQRRSLRGMVSLDRVGVGAVVPIGSAEPGDPLAAELVHAARRVGVPTAAESGQRSSDHWSFVRAGLPGVRLGSTPYAGYHSADDVVAVVDPDHAARAARVVVSWLRQGM